MPAISYDPNRFIPQDEQQKRGDQSRPSDSAYGQFQQALNQQSANAMLQQGGMQAQNLAQQLMAPKPVTLPASFTRRASSGGGGGGGGVWTGGPLTASGQASWGSFAQDLLKSLGVPNTPQNQSAIMTWFISEQPPNSPNATWNPLNIQNADFSGRGYTQSRPGQWNFPSEQVGIQAIVRELTSRMYAPILQALQRGTDPTGVLSAIQASPWAASHYGGNLVGRYNPNYYLSLAGGRIAG